MSPEAKKLITSIADELREGVKAIEAGAKMTQNHYGRYMAILGQAKTRGQRHVIALALIEAGANSAGVKSALSIHG